MGRKSSIINLTAEDREYLEMQTRARTIQAQTVSRARIGNVINGATICFQ